MNGDEIDYKELLKKIVFLITEEDEFDFIYMAKDKPGYFDFWEIEFLKKLQESAN